MRNEHSVLRKRSSRSAASASSPSCTGSTLTSTLSEPRCSLSLGADWVRNTELTGHASRFVLQPLNSPNIIVAVQHVREEPEHHHPSSHSPDTHTHTHTHTHTRCLCAFYSCHSSQTGTLKCNIDKVTYLISFPLCACLSPINTTYISSKSPKLIENFNVDIQANTFVCSRRGRSQEENCKVKSRQRATPVGARNPVEHQRVCAREQVGYALAPSVG